MYILYMYVCIYYARMINQGRNKASILRTCLYVCMCVCVYMYVYICICTDICNIWIYIISLK